MSAIIALLWRGCDLMDRATGNRLPCYLGTWAAKLEDRAEVSS